MNEECVNILKKKFHVNYDKNMFQNEEKIKKEISNYEGIIVRNKTQLQKSIIDNASKLKFVGRFILNKRAEPVAISIYPLKSKYN